MRADENNYQSSDIVSQFMDAMNIEDPQKRVLMTQIIAPQFADYRPTDHGSIQAARPAVKRLQNITEILASALGACAECWGQRKSCPQCRGKGKPGAFRPDPEAYAYFVAPVVKKMTALRGKGQFKSTQRKGGRYGS